MPASRAPALSSAPARYALAVASVGTVFAIQVLVGPILVFAFFLGGVLVAAWNGGTRAGIFAIALSIVTLAFVLKRPPFEFWTDAEFPPRIITFTLSASVLLFMSAARRKSERALRAAHAELEKQAAARLVRTKQRARQRVIQARLEARLAERTRLAREIHDTLLQGFTGVSLQLLATMGRKELGPESRAALSDVLAVAQKTLADARQAVWEMRPPPLAGDDFVGSLGASLDFTLAGTTLAFDYLVRGVPRRIQPEVETALLRVAQEAVTNIVRHAEARTVRVVLSFHRRSVELTVEDDGRGFVVEPELRTFAGRWGLLGMRERASQLHAKLSVQSVPGAGTKVVLRVPTRARALSEHGAAPDGGGRSV